MKKLISILLCSLVMLGLIGCNSNKKEVETKETQVANNNSDSKNKEIKLNEVLEVKTKSGDYNITIKSVTKTDWWKKEHNNDDKTVILLNLECENINFKNESHNGVKLYNSFDLKDNNKHKLSKSSTKYSDDNNGLEEVLPNTKGKISIPYIVDNNATSVSVEFSKGGILKDAPIIK